jgi:hypothetical protein
MYFNFSNLLEENRIVMYENNDECILIYSSQKSSSLQLKSSSQLFSLDESLIDVRVFISLEINTYPRRIRRSSNLGHIFRGGKCVL